MELSEASELRSVLEIVIRDFIKHEVTKFEEETGLVVVDVDIDKVESQDMGKSYVVNEISGVTVKVFI